VTSIKNIEGVADAKAAKLAKAGIRSVEKLLAAGATPKGRKAIAEASGLKEENILTWVNHADLFRIKGVAGQYAELLEAAGVDTVAELAKRKPANLHEALLGANRGKKKLVRQPPALGMVERWVAEAKTLPKVVKH
jgi:predicted flap endonuclease-1-like 5' DNA nuclease